MRVLVALGACLAGLGVVVTAYHAGARSAVQVEVDGRDYGPAVSIEYTPGVMLRVETLNGPQCVFIDGFEEVD